jgi:carbamoyltransferase
MYNIGINEGINSSVVVEKDGVIVFALQEERITKIKNYMGFPHAALSFTLNYMGIDKEGVAAIMFSNLTSNVITNELYAEIYNIRADRLTPGPEIQRLKDMTREEKNECIARELDKHGLGSIPVIRTHHHLNHAAAAYFGMRKNSSEPHLVITLDSGGDMDCAHVYMAVSNRLELLFSTPGGNSVGNIYTSVTHMLGLVPHEHEYKVMGLAAYSKPEFYESILNQFRCYLDVDPDQPTSFKRKIEEPTTEIAYRLAQDLKRKRFDNIAGAIQAFTEELIVKWVRELVKQTGIKNVVTAGGVFMNIKVNALLSELEGIEYYQVFPSCGDETLPFGALWLNYAERSPTRGEDIRFDSFCLGPDAAFDLDQAKVQYGDRLQYTRLEDPEQTIAELLHRGEIVARCSDRMEFGARGLGNRSLLADPSNSRVVPQINRMIKQRDFYMPFAPAVLQERMDRYLRIPDSLRHGGSSPYMMFSFDSTLLREEFIAAVHPYDATARAQIVAADLYPRFHRLLSRFEALSGRGIVLNTSYNLHGFPLVLGAVDAMDVMCQSSLDYLVINDTLVTKLNQE